MTAAARLARDRDRVLVLSAAAWWALPGIVESLRLPEGADTSAEWAAAARDADPAAPAVAGGPEADGAWPLTRPATALVVHADAEGRWNTPARAAREQQRIVDALHDEVRAQGATASRAELENLVRVDIAPRGGFELANFSLDELAVAIAGLAGHDAAALEAQLVGAIAAGRGIDAVLGPLRVSKPRLATALLPLLLDRLPDEVANGATTPIIRAVLTAVDVASSMPRGRVVLSPTDGG